MSEKFNDNDNDTADKGGSKPSGGTPSSVGGFFDSLIADFSLDETDDIHGSLTAADSSDKDDENAAPVVEVVDSLAEEMAAEKAIAEKSAEYFEKSVDDIIVLYDAEKKANTVEEEYVPESAYDDDDTESAAVPEAEPDGAESSGAASFLRGLFPSAGDSVGEIIRKIVFLCAVIVFVVSGCMLISTLIQSDRAVRDGNDNESRITTTLATTLVTNDSGETVVETIMPTEEEIQAHNFSVMEYYKGMNPDVVGYIELEGCDIYEPVVQTTDNEYYLTHTYYKGENKAGSIFMDYRCTVSEDHFSPNIVLYGHNQQDGTMFGNLKYYKNDIDFYRQNPIVKFNTDYGTGDYVIFAYFVTNALEKHDKSKEVFHYQDYIETLKKPSTFAWYMFQIQKRSQIESPVDVVYGDELLVLSTCSNEYADSRFVVFARRLRSGETIDSFDFFGTQNNTGEKKIDWNEVMSVTTVPRTYYIPPATTTASIVTEAPVWEETVTADSNTEEETTVFQGRVFIPDDTDETETGSRRKRTSTVSETEVTAEPDDMTESRTRSAETTIVPAAETTHKRTSAETETSRKQTSAKTETTSADTAEAVTASASSSKTVSVTVTESPAVTETSSVMSTKSDVTVPVTESSAQTEPVTAQETEPHATEPAETEPPETTTPYYYYSEDFTPGQR